MKLNVSIRYLACAGAVAGLLAGASTGCGSAVNQQPPAASASASRPAATAAFVGYKWTVVSIVHGGKATPISAKYRVYLAFTPAGQYGANDTVNFHSGKYAVTSDGFAASDVAVTLVGYDGNDPVRLLAIDAIAAFDHGTRAQTLIDGNTLSITVNGYTLTAQRAGTQANWPLPQGT